MKRSKSSLRFLIIEDVKEHETLILEAVHTHDFLHDVSSVKNCQMALQLLEEYKNESALPHIVILDLDVGGMDARDFLKKFIADPDYASIPVFALTAKANENDRAFINSLPSCIYIVKPAGIVEFMELVNFICNFWGENKAAPDYQNIRKRMGF